MSMEDVTASQLGDVLTLTESTREERLRRHCVLTTQALLHRSEALNDVCFKCSDNEYAFAHKFILGTQCQYFRSVLYKEGIMDVSTNSIKGKKYRFTSSSRCFKSLQEFLYTGQIMQLEQPKGSVDSCLPHVGELLALSRQPNNKKDGMGGLDRYLIALLCRSKPQNIRAAMQRLETAHKSNVQEVMDATTDVIPTLKFTRDAFQDVGPEVVEQVLRDVPLKAPEIEVWRAIKSWADEFFDDLSDPDFSSPTSNATDDAPPVVPEHLKVILQFIDLDCISWKEVAEEILPLKLFDHRQVQAARKTQALKKTGLLPSRPSERRGAEAEDAGATVIDPTVL